MRTIVISIMMVALMKKRIWHIGSSDITVVPCDFSILKESKSMHPVLRCCLLIVLIPVINSILFWSKLEPFYGEQSFISEP